MRLPTGLQTGPAKRVQKIRPILIVQEDGLALISTAEHVIERTCVLYPEGTGHHGSLPGNQTAGQGGGDSSEEFK